MEKKYKILWKGREAGPYTLEQIQAMLNARQIGLAHQILHEGKWIFIEEFLAFLEFEQQQQTQKDELNRLEQERAGKHERQMDMVKAQEDQREAEHRREVELQQIHVPPPALPQLGEPVPEAPQPGYPHQPVTAEAGGNSAIKTGGGFTVFVIVALGFLWYQGYWDPSDIKAIWGQSKSIEVIRNNKFGDSGKTIGQAIATNLTGVEWKSKRGKSREEVIITCTGDVKEDDESFRIQFLWVVNKGDKAFQMTEISIDGAAIKKDKWGAFIVLLLLD
jgi:hypothetical protein